MFTPREHHLLGKIFLSLGTPGGTLVLNQNVIKKFLEYHIILFFY